MKLKKPTVKSCIDGDDHSWMVVNEDTDIMTGRRWERRWCHKCGCLTQIHIIDGEAVALLNEKGKPHLVMPQLTEAASRLTTKPAAARTTKKARTTKTTRTTKTAGKAKTRQKKTTPAS